MKNKQEKEPRKSLRVLFADDEENLQKLTGDGLRRMGHQVTVCPDGITAVAALEKNTFDCMLVDINMPGLTGIQVIERAKDISPSTECIVLTGNGSKQTAIEALRFGAFDYIDKPYSLATLEKLLNQVAEKLELQRRCQALQLRANRAEGDMQMVGNHRSVQRVKALIEKVAPTDSTVLIRGETGTGKELAARAVHDNSRRRDKQFVAVNCGALPENLIESELFGHRKGAFTGADEHRIGLFEVADGGTLFLDEIGELPKSLQAKLLRVLESGEIRRVGDNNSFKVDVRLVCATHRNLDQMVAVDEFREDLMYRINTFEVNLPSLRDRIEDIPLLAHHLLKRFRSEVGSIDQAFDSRTLEVLQEYVWPGNVRELANVIEHASILCDELPIEPEHLPRHFGTRSLPSLKAISSGNTLRELEMAAIESALERHSGNKTAAADELGVSLKTLYNKLNQTGKKAA
jgi:DNA-binding NtrC family response regulator